MSILWWVFLFFVVVIAIYYFSSQANFMKLVSDAAAAVTRKHIEDKKVFNIAESTCPIDAEGRVVVTKPPLQQEEMRSIVKQVKRNGKKWKGEQICREAISKITGKEFVKAHPLFLRNPETGRSLELDCYNEELKLAIEYHGPHHVEYPNWLSRKGLQSYDDFLYQLAKDDYKRRACEAAGVYLIEVYYDSVDSLDDIPDYIYHKLPEDIFEYN